MARLIESPIRIQAAGQPPKIIEEFIGRVASRTEAVSIARMTSPEGWSEPKQTPLFDEYTVVLRGCLVVETATGTTEARAGQAIIAPRGSWIRYSTPHAGGAEYVAVCLPAFSPDTVQREES
jgi:ethanolamine utilization protein EutQ (cupin superfamily)